MSLRRILPLALIALTLTATGASAHAVDATIDLAAPTALAPVAGAPAEAAAPSAGPRLDQGRSGIAAVREVASTAPTPVPQEISRRRGVPQMIIGGAAILGGAVMPGRSSASADSCMDSTASICTCSSRARQGWR